MALRHHGYSLVLTQFRWSWLLPRPGSSNILAVAVRCAACSTGKGIKLRRQQLETYLIPCKLRGYIWEPVLLPCGDLQWLGQESVWFEKLGHLYCKANNIFVSGVKLVVVVGFYSFMGILVWAVVQNKLYLFGWYQNIFLFCNFDLALSWYIIQIVP